jgi:hypothetical protein
MTAKHKPLKAPKGKKGIADQLRWLREHMLDIATSMDYYGGFDSALAIHGRDLAGAAGIVQTWIEGIELDIANGEADQVAKTRLRAEGSP